MTPNKTCRQKMTLTMSKCYVNICNYTKNEDLYWGFLQELWPNPQFPAYLVTFTVEILKETLYTLAVYIANFEQRCSLVYIFGLYLWSFHITWLGWQFWIMEEKETYRNLLNVRDYHQISLLILTLPVPWVSESCIKIKIKLTFYFHSSLRCLERFYEGL